MTAHQTQGEQLAAADEDFAQTLSYLTNSRSQGESSGPHLTSGLYLNINGLESRIDALCTLIRRVDPDEVSLTETKMADKEARKKFLNSVFINVTLQLYPESPEQGPHAYQAIFSGPTTSDSTGGVAILSKYKCGAKLSRSLGYSNEPSAACDMDGRMAYLTEWLFSMMSTVSTFPLSSPRAL